VAAALLAAGAWPLAVNARLEGRSPWRELGGASLSALVLVLYGVAKLAAVRHPSVAPWIPVAACGAIGVAALATARPRRRAWAWAAAWLGLAAWLAVGAWK
jgi:hypothetical protein